LVREISYYDGDISSFVPKHVKQTIFKKWADKKSQE